MIEFKNVTKTYDTGTEAVHNASFTIEKGEFAFLVGASGSGKSTLIKLILKEEAATKGKKKHGSCFSRFQTFTR